MQLKTVVAMFSLGSGCLLGGCTLPEPLAVTNQPLGGPCTGDADCSSGLHCRNFLSTGYPPPSPQNSSYQSRAEGETSSLCTSSCGATACPAGSVCLTESGGAVDAGAEGLCVPACSTDSDCQHGGRAQVCSTVADAGPSVCQFLECRSFQSSLPCGPPPNFRCGSPECPTGFSCVARQADPGGQTYGFCQKR